jgi:hypothetical protein
MSQIAIVYHSGHGHTARPAEAVVRWRLGQPASQAA